MMRNKMTLLLGLGLLIPTGCQTIQTPWSKPDELASTLPASQAPADQDPMVAIEDNKDIMDRTTDFLQGKRTVNRQEARSLYREAEQQFQTAGSEQGSARKRQFRKAASTFEKASKRWNSSALEEDALMMMGESYFFAEDYPKADQAYGDLLEKYSRSRHIDKVASRRFEIAQYWLNVDEHGSNVIPVNFTNRRLPMVDLDGTGIKLLDQIRYDAPTGKLADDATMAAGIEYFEREKWILADGFFTDLRETFPDSDHQFNAHMFGVKCKLEIYQGPKYSGTVLDEAKDLIKRISRQFPNEIQDPENRETIAKAAAQLDHLYAERYYHRAQYREKRSEHGAAKFYYQQILDKHAKTSFADTARERLAQLEGRPDLPPERLAWLKSMFPDSEAAKPIMVGSSNSILR